MSAPKPEKKDMLQPVDDEARRLAKTLLRCGRFAALAHAQPTDGWPWVSRVSLAADMAGRPSFLISQLSPHFAGLEADSRCSLLIGEPGKGDPLAHPRMTLVGWAERLSEDPAREHVRRRFLLRHPKADLYADFGDFAFWRVNPERISLNAGFGKAYELSPSDILSEAACLDALAEVEAGAVAHMNEDHGDAIDLYVGAALGRPASGWSLAALDPEGLDLVKGDETTRFWFAEPLREASDLRPVLVEHVKSLR